MMIRTSTLLLALLLAGCSSSLLYRIDIQQGNLVTQEMVAKLKPGMSRSQVRFALGTPMVADIFHADRWDYVYFLDKAGVRRDERRLAVYFEGDKLLRVEQDGPLPETPKPAASTPAAGPAPQASSMTPAETVPLKPQ